jgi:hypothetical protein
VTRDRFWIGNRIYSILTTKITITVHGSTQFTIHYTTHLIFSVIFLHQSSNIGFKRRMFLFLWVPELSSCLSNDISAKWLSTSTFSLGTESLRRYSRRRSLYKLNLTQAELELTAELSWYCDRWRVGLSVLVSNNPLGPKIRFFFFLSFAGKLFCSSSWGALSHERAGL